MKKDPKVFLKHIIDSIENIDNYTKGKSESQFLNSEETQDAVMRRLAVIGEAAKNLPSSLREKNKTVNWKAIIGLKNVIVHEYFGVDMKIIWNIVKKDMPDLKSAVTSILEEK